MCVDVHVSQLRRGRHPTTNARIFDQARGQLIDRATFCQRPEVQQDKESVLSVSLLAFVRPTLLLFGPSLFPDHSDLRSRSFRPFANQGCLRKTWTMADRS